MAHYEEGERLRCLALAGSRWHPKMAKLISYSLCVTVGVVFSSAHNFWPSFMRQLTCKNFMEEHQSVSS